MSPSSAVRVAPSAAPELMDDPDCDPEVLDRALDALVSVNRWLGGTAAIRRPLQRTLRHRRPGSLRILDVGTGAGDIPAALDLRLRATGWVPHFCLADSHARTLEFARERLRRTRARAAVESSPTFVRLDAPRLPFSTASFDLALSGTMVHHLETDAAVAFLRELDRVSRLGWVVSDLRRGMPIRFAVGLLGRVAWRRNEIARRDGHTSARRAFTAAEVDALLRRAGLRSAVVRRGPFRWVALGGELAGEGVRNG